MDVVDAFQGSQRLQGPQKLSGIRRNLQNGSAIRAFSTKGTGVSEKSQSIIKIDSI